MIPLCGRAFAAPGLPTGLSANRHYLIKPLQKFLEPVEQLAVTHLIVHRIFLLSQIFLQGRPAMCKSPGAFLLRGGCKPDQSIGMVREFAISCTISCASYSLQMPRIFAVSSRAPYNIVRLPLSSDFQCRRTHSATPDG